MVAQNPYATPAASLQRQTNRHSTGVDETSIFSPRGRFGRITYTFWNIALGLLALLVIGVLMAASGGLSGLAENPEGAMAAVMAGNVALIMLLGLAMLPIGIIFTIRRLHDLDWSGWLALLMIIPLVSTVLFLLLILRKGSAGDNSYGPPPRQWNMLQAIVAVPLIALVVIGLVAQVAMMVVLPFL